MTGAISLVGNTCGSGGVMGQGFTSPVLGAGDPPSTPPNFGPIPGAYCGPVVAGGTYVR